MEGKQLMYQDEQCQRSYPAPTGNKFYYGLVSSEWQFLSYCQKAWEFPGPVFVHQIPELLSPQKSPADSKLLEALPVR
ncbi:hypothetical protein T4B_15093 [Trichinella pseudospiralis]|uniref:Uncharacterized protein n=1 Tax=Trichinella pseudospiralis TaxID=6337 RepID=A0A0V1EPU1_TRIPS|nr:hypothetical protein T4A_9290 [Trichinella pseudospiralis]KRZ23887.1 hypothetical protein T4B_15093 [Trichinella pseudospiralis]KRZ27389.1 hypothetical protein T4C_644 [Trichinella pseudospiralis]